MSAKGGAVWRLHASTLLHSFLFAMLLLLHRLRRLAQAAKGLIPFSKAANTPTPDCCAPRHVALSGELAQHPQAVALLLEVAARAGAAHTTVHDPWESIDAQALAAALEERCRATSWVVVEHKGGVYDAGSVAPRVWRVGSAEHSGEDVAVSVMLRGGGRAAIVRAARDIAARAIAEGRVGKEGVGSVAEVTEWLDGAEGMLPSEPDVVVVFPPAEKGERANVLHEFLVWQMRLTQICFARTPVSEMSPVGFREIMAGAAGVAKRFGR